MLKLLNCISWFFGKAADLFWVMTVKDFKEVKDECGIAFAIFKAIVNIFISLIALTLMLIIIFTFPIWNFILYVIKLIGFPNLDSTMDQWLDEALDEFEKHDLM